MDANRRRRDGFTLIEIMAVIVILGLLTALVSMTVVDRIEWARVQTTKIKLKGLEGSLEMFRLDQRS